MTGWSPHYLLIYTLANALTTPTHTHRAHSTVRLQGTEHFSVLNVCLVRVQQLSLHNRLTQFMFESSFTHALWRISWKSVCVCTCSRTVSDVGDRPEVWIEVEHLSHSCRCLDTTRLDYFSWHQISSSLSWKRSGCRVNISPHPCVLPLVYTLLLRFSCCIHTWGSARAGLCLGVHTYRILEDYSVCVTVTETKYSVTNIQQ